MIKDMLKRENVRLVESVKSWEDAIILSTQSLLDQGYITQQYPDKIIELTKKYGPYYALAPFLALVHARPEDGVIKKQLAVILLHNPVNFKGDTTPIRLLITLAAENSESHLDVLRQLGELLSDENVLKQLLNATSEEMLYDLLTKYENGDK